MEKEIDQGGSLLQVYCSETPPLHSSSHFGFDFSKKAFPLSYKKAVSLGQKVGGEEEEEDPDRREGGLGAVWVGGSKGGERANPFSDVYHTFLSLSFSVSFIPRFRFGEFPYTQYDL